MNDKTLMVYIGTAEDALKDFMAAWKSGKPAKPVNRLSFESMGGYMKAFTPKRWELLEVLKRNNGQNINQLAQALNRDYKNVHTDIQTLLDLGIVEKDRAGWFPCLGMKSKPMLGWEWGGWQRDYERRIRCNNLAIP